MSDVEFEGDNGKFQSRKIFGKPTTPKLVIALMKYFHIKKERTAGNILVGSLLVFLFVAGFIIYKTAFPHPPQEAKVNNALPEKVKAALPKN